MIFVFKRNGNITSLWSTCARNFPNSRVYGDAAFGAECDGRYIGGLGKAVYQYTEVACWQNWHKLPSTNKGREYSRSCTIGSSLILVTGGNENGNSAELLNLDENTSSCIPAAQSRSSFWKKWTNCSTKLPVSVHDHTLTRVGRNRVMLIGGYDQDVGASNRAFRGLLTEDQKDVIWDELPSLSTSRNGHFTFRIRDSIFVAGGFGDTYLSCCEKYDLKQNEWRQTQHYLPYPLFNASVVVDTEQNLAVITGGFTNQREASDKVIIFNEERGFVLLNEFSLRQRRFGHVSLLIEEKNNRKCDQD